ncbi:hypothetical protein D3C77_403020 [compost metagenome]
MPRQGFVTGRGEGSQALQGEQVHSVDLRNVDTAQQPAVEGERGGVTIDITKVLEKLIKSLPVHASPVTSIELGRQLWLAGQDRVESLEQHRLQPLRGQCRYAEGYLDDLFEVFSSFEAGALKTLFDDVSLEQQ